jgi:hypothetical protein
MIHRLLEGLAGCENMHATSCVGAVKTTSKMLWRQPREICNYEKGRLRVVTSPVEGERI